jgi:TonB family protein
MNRLLSTAFTAVALLTACVQSPEMQEKHKFMDFSRQMLIAIDNKSYGPLKGHHGGLVTVGFDYMEGGKAGNPQIVESSGDPVLDEAALTEVRNAALPERPPELAGVKHFVVRISF